MEVKVLDIEIEMHAFRLLRGGNFNTAKEMLEAVMTDFPNEDPERIKTRLAALARKLIDD